MLPRELKLPKNNSFFLFGPRQVGKTSLVRMALGSEKQLHYDLLKSEEYFRLTARPGLLSEEIAAARANIDFVVIDEIQRVPALLDEVHRLIETPEPPIFVLTGSSARKLKRSGSNMLGGRAWNLKLFPLTHRELGEQFKLSRALSLGTLPKIYLSDDASAHQFLRSYVETYLKEEIEAEALVRSLGVFLRFLSLAAQESGNILNYATLSRDVASSAKTIREYYSILEDTLIGNFLPAFHKSTRKRLASHPKFYLFDTGILRALNRMLTVPLEPQ
ncbi:MAG: AAA family ATPase, partial [Proteobacteria bacterium]|nr:AAA family ATPase [Pseudomonadota bacterium]